MQFQSNMPQLRVQKISVNRGSVPVIRDLDLDCHAGEIIWLRGANGSGKTTFLNAIAGFLSYDGQIFWQNLNVQDDIAAFRSRIAWFDDANGVRPDLTVRENIASLNLDEDDGLLSEGLAHFHLNDKCDIPTRYLSQGQVKRLALASLYLQTDKDLWLLDEPLANLDDDAASKLQMMISMRQLAGKITIFSSHQNPTFKPSQVLQMDKS